MPKITLTAFGESLSLQTIDSAFFNGDTRWRLQHLYSPYFASRAFAGDGLVLDVGAGIGGFALLFAKAFPQTRVLCFEPDPELFGLLQDNIQSSGLHNVVAHPIAIGIDVPQSLGSTALTATSLSEDWRACSTKRAFLAYEPSRSYLEPATGEPPPGARLVEFDTVHASALATLKPVVVKITAPLLESGILSAFSETDVQHLVGESWTDVDSTLIYRQDQPARQFFVRRAGAQRSLRRDLPVNPTIRDGLDIVIPMYNASRHIEACVTSLITHARDDIRVLVVDDGSTDGSAEVVANRFANEPRVQLLRKPNGGCASARNHGRRHSTATHIAFVDADDTVDADLFPRLLELARYTSAETVQAGFDFMDDAAEGVSFRESYEADIFRDFKREPFQQSTYFTAPCAVLIEGQPTIWRRIYRRDFLDNKKIHFPEHIRSFDDLIFHILTLYHSRDIPTLDGPRYHYRQHPQQDIKQADERHFYALEMYRMIVKRGLQEGWNDFAPILRSMVNTVNWSMGLLRSDLAPLFLEGAAKLWVYLEKATPMNLRSDACKDVKHTDFMYLVAQQRQQMRSAQDDVTFSYLDTPLMHPSLIKRLL